MTIAEIEGWVAQLGEWRDSEIEGKKKAARQARAARAARTTQG